MVFGEGRRERVLVDAAVAIQDGDDRARHLGVVGPPPRFRRQGAGFERGQVVGDEEAAAERVADGEPPQRRDGAGTAVGDHSRDSAQPQ
nr:hypothetical protein [Nocardia amikacinitolerans]